jgi:hypothetical protein
MPAAPIQRGHGDPKNLAKEGEATLTPWRAVAYF